MARATGAEGLTVSEAVRKYHHELDLIARQYALVPGHEQPRCLGQMVHVIDGQRFSVLPGLVQAYVETFVRILDLIQVSRIDPVTKRIVAGFETVAARERAFDAIRDAGYTVVPPVSA